MSRYAPRIAGLRLCLAGAVLACVAPRLSVSSAGEPAGAAIPNAGLVLWLSARDVEVQDGGVVQITDRSGKGNHAQHDRDPQNVLKNPAVAKDAGSGQPVLRFSGQYSSFSFPRISDIRTVFWVVSKDPKAMKQRAERFVLGDSEAKDFHVGSHFTDYILDKGGDASLKLREGRAWLNGRPIDARTTDFPGQLCVVTLEATGSVQANQISKDRKFPNRSWQGDIAEILVFNVVLADSDRQAVENHLLRKYSIAPGGK